MYEECNGAEKYYFYDSNGIISGIRYFDANGTMTMIYVVTNSQGDVIALYDRNGNAVVEYQYDAWGNIISTTNTTEGSSLDWNEVNPFRYRGYYYDSETGLYYLQSRYYDAEVGRFINQDSYVSTGTGLLGYNMFAYCDNNPVLYSDSEGNRPIVGAGPISKETAEERSLSCTAMNPKRTKIPDLPKRKFWSYLKEAVDIEVGFGYGLGGSLEIDGLSLSGEARFNVYEGELINGEWTNYAYSLKGEGSLGSFATEHGIKYGLRFDLTNSELDEDDTLFYEEIKDKFVLGGSYYKGWGGHFYITIDWSEFNGLF